MYIDNMFSGMSPKINLGTSPQPAIVSLLILEMRLGLVILTPPFGVIFYNKTVTVKCF